MSNFVSIIVPVYNPPKLLFRKCIESLMNQNYSEYEVILVNDGSREEYVDLINSYIAGDSRFTLVNKENEGVSIARNVGINMSKGNYISFVDSDDFLEPHFLSTMVDIIKDADMAICSLEEQYFPTPNRFTDIKSFLMQPEDYMWLQYVNFCHNKLYKAKIIKENKIFFPEGIKLGEDALFLNKYYKNIKSIRMTSKRLYHYIPNATSAVNKYDNNFWEWERNVIDTQYDLFNTYGLSKRQEMALTRWLYDKIKYALNYYMDRCTDKFEQDEYLNIISQDRLFDELVNSDFKNNLFLNRNDRFILGLWKRYHLKGVKLARKISKIVRKLRR